MFAMSKGNKISHCGPSWTNQAMRYGQKPLSHEVARLALEELHVQGGDDRTVLAITFLNLHQFSKFLALNISERSKQLNEHICDT